MSDIRLEEVPFELDGKTYKLRCNMNVLADVQEAYNGDFTQALSEKNGLKSVLIFLAAMLNDYADEMGWPERYTARQLGRKYKRFDIPAELVMGVVIRSITPEQTEEAESGN